jgi:hypothetical protein
MNVLMLFSLWFSSIHLKDVRFEVFTAVTMKNFVFWDDKPGSVAFLPYVRTIFNRISRVAQHNIKSVGLPPKKISGFLQMVKENLGPRTLGVYRIPCE